MTQIFTASQFVAHETPPGHPEQSDRAAVVERALRHGALGQLKFRDSPVADREALERCHETEYIDHVFRVGQNLKGLVALDADTTMGPSSLDAALRGAGAACAAVDAVAAGEASNAFVASRPPGHHAVPGSAMGFCLFNNVAIAARHARAVHGLNRIAVVDFDVHHGNGTQDILENDADALFASSHEWPQYPGSGRDDERGRAQNCHNATLNPGDGGLAFRRCWGDRLLPALEAFEPDIIVVSAGFDGHEADPLGGLRLREEDFAWVTRELLNIASDRCDGRIVSVLEGGYDLPALAASVQAHVKTLATYG